MQKTKMILTAIAIVSVVGSALAFTNKANLDSTFCAKPIAGGTGTCTAILQKDEASGTNTHYIFTGYVNETLTPCLQQNCATAIRLVTE